MTAVEDRLRAELSREAARFEPRPDAWARLQQREPRRESTRWAPAAAAAVVLLVVVAGTVLALRGDRTTNQAAGSATCATARANATVLSNPGFDQASLTAFVVGEVLCVRAGDQYWGTEVGSGALPAAGLTSMKLTLDSASPAESLVVGLLGSPDSTVRLTDLDTHQPISTPIRYIAVDGQRLFYSLSARPVARVSIAALGSNGQVAAVRTTVMRKADHSN